jgi:hypothetical protein
MTAADVGAATLCPTWFATTARGAHGTIFSGANDMKRVGTCYL